MNELKIIAVGSNLHIAAEIKDICCSILGNRFQIELETTDNIKLSLPNCLYVCANTQADKLRDKISAYKLMVFDLRPTAHFFIELLKIPQGETVYIFNNLLPYITMMKHDLEQMHVSHLNFEPIAYEEIGVDATRKILQRAKYIMGVDRFVGDKVLLSDTYKPYLRDDVRIISGKRTASVAATGRLLEAIATFYITEAEIKRNAIIMENGSPEMLRQLSVQVELLLGTLRAGALQSVMNQLDGRDDNEYVTLSNEAEKENSPLSSTWELDKLDNELKTFRYLRKRIQRLTL